MKDMKYGGCGLTGVVTQDLPEGTEEGHEYPQKKVTAAMRTGYLQYTCRAHYRYNDQRGPLPATKQA